MKRSVHGYCRLGRAAFLPLLTLVAADAIDTTAVTRLFGPRWRRGV